MNLVMTRGSRICNGISIALSETMTSLDRPASSSLSADSESIGAKAA